MLSMTTHQARTLPEKTLKHILVGQKTILEIMKVQLLITLLIEILLLEISLVRQWQSILNYPILILTGTH